MVGMGMVKADDTLPPVPRQLERGDHLFRMDAIAVGRGIRPHVLAGQGHGDHTVPTCHTAKQNAAALMGITALGFPADEVVISLADLKHETVLLGSGGFTSDLSIIERRSSSSIFDSGQTETT